MLSDAASAAGPIVGASRPAVNDTATTTDYPDLSRRSHNVNKCFSKFQLNFERNGSGTPVLVTAPSFEAQANWCREGAGTHDDEGCTAGCVALCPTSRTTGAMKRD